MVVFKVEGRPGSVRFSKTLFTNHTPPATLTQSDASFGPPPSKETQTLCAMPCAKRELRSNLEDTWHIRCETARPAAACTCCRASPAGDPFRCRRGVQAMRGSLEPPAGLHCVAPSIAPLALWPKFVALAACTVAPRIALPFALGPVRLAETSPRPTRRRGRPASVSASRRKRSDASRLPR
jgi:hypothetical protein